MTISPVTAVEAVRKEVLGIARDLPARPMQRGRAALPWARR